MDTTVLNPMLQAILTSLSPEKLKRLTHIITTYPGVPFSELPKNIQHEVYALLAHGSSPPGPSKPPASAEIRRHPALSQGQPHNGHRNGPTARPLPIDPRPLVSFIGTDLKTGWPVTISQKARQQGLYIIGATGTGKTTLLANLILSDIKEGRGVMLVEPHGDLTHTVIAGIPDERLKDVIYLDMTDALHPFSVNLYECADPTNMSEVAKVSSFVMHLFERVWDIGTHTPLLAQVVRNITRTCIETGLTFAEIPLLLWEDTVRDKVIKQVKNAQTQLFWQQYKRKSPRDRTEYVSSTINKVDAYLNEPMIAHIVSQAQSTISFRKIMDEEKILLLHMSPQLEEMSRLIGALLIGKLLMAAYSRVDMPEKQRRQFHLYVDEFEKFCTDDFSVLIAEARKFRVAIGALANQTLEQLNDASRAAALQAGNLICFRVSGEDARVLAQSFNTTPTEPYVIGEEAVRSPTNDTINFLLKKAHTNPDAMACNRYLEYLLHFAGQGLAPPPVHTPRGHYPNPRGSAAESVLEGLGDAVVVILCTFFHRRKYRKAQGLVSAAQHCIMLLNTYFFEVMLRRDPTLPIPQEVMALFGQREFLTREGLPDFLAALRTVAATLAQAPILVETGQYRPRLQNRTYSDMEGEISNYLTNQDNYRARVKLLISEHVIKTNPLPPFLPESEVQKRIAVIKQRMLLLGLTKPYREVQREIELRHARLRERPDADAPPPPPHTNGRRVRHKPPPAHT